MILFYFVISTLFLVSTHHSFCMKTCVNSMACGRHTDLVTKAECVQTESRKMKSIVLPSLTVDRKI